MTVAITPFLRNALSLDALATGATGLLMIAGSSFLGPLLNLPEGLLFWAGLALVPFVALLALYARRTEMPKLVLVDIIAINALWVAGSFGLLVSGAVSPNLLGYAFVIAQALTVALFAELQFIGMRRGLAARAG